MQAQATEAPAHSPPTATSNRNLALMLGALGVVYGDIGTSPLYALRECFHGPHGTTPTPDNVLGVLSLIVWSLILVISVKYVVFVMRADNKGEGGILALMALVCPPRPSGERPHGWERTAVALGLFGAALLYGDGMITPAISVLSAVEGLEIAAPGLARFVVPLTVCILIGLFLIQRRGTGGIGRIFGPVILVWFSALALLGLAELIQRPSVLAALLPTHALGFLFGHGWHGLLVLGSVFLVVTGGEALYADMGHFGARPIRAAWFGLVLPALLLHYFGQGALLLGRPEAAENPFYLLVPSWALYPMVALSTAATVIASQALISGAFSLTHQAVQLGYLPRLPIRHTSAEEMGQIYIGPVNWALLLATIGLVLGFRTSSALAAAYGIAVTATMGITTVLLYRAMRQLWRWPAAPAVALGAAFLAVDLAFFSANAVKVADGGWFPLLVGVGVYVLLSTWYDGRRLLYSRLQEQAISLRDFLQQEAPLRVPRVPGTAVFMTGQPSGTPPALVQNLRHNKVLHEQVLLLTVQVDPVPSVPEEQRIEVEERGKGVWRLRAHYGFMEYPNAMRLIEQCRSLGVPADPEDTTFFVSAESMFATERPGLALWREKLFILMARNAYRATQFFRIPPTQVIEIGVHIEL
jgi:KUP system potassium uptake protein